MKVKIEGEPSLVKDTNTGAILNINSSSIRAARQAKQKRKLSEDRLDKLEYELSQIKTLLQKLVDTND